MKIRMILIEKGLSFERRFVNSWTFDHFRPAYQALNPLSIVPTFVDEDGTSVIQSNVIAEYLEQRYDSPALLPQTPALAAQAREWMLVEQDDLFPIIVTLSFNSMMKLRVQVFGFEKMAKWAKAFPDQDKAQDYLKRVTAPVDIKAVKLAKEKFDFHMQRLEAQLLKHDGPWVCGTQFTLADICLAGIIDRIEYLDNADLYTRYSNVSRWYEGLKARHSFQQGAHLFEDRMWGPLKSPEKYPYKAEPKHIWGYWNNTKQE